MQHYKNNAKKKLIKKLFIKPIVFMIGFLACLFEKPKTAATVVHTEEKGDLTMANFTVKETNLLFKTIIERELGIHIADDIKDLRSKTDLFENANNINIEKISETVDTTRVSIFRTTYCDNNGDDAVAYTHTI